MLTLGQSGMAQRSAALFNYFMRLVVLIDHFDVPFRLFSSRNTSIVPGKKNPEIRRSTEWQEKGKEKERT